MEKICSIKNVIDISYKNHLDYQVCICLPHRKRKLSVTEIQTAKTVTPN